MITAKIIDYAFTKNVDISFICSDPFTWLSLHNICNTIKDEKYNIYKSGLTIYKTWEDENVKKQDDIKREIQYITNDIQNFKKNNRLQIIFYKDISEQLKQKYNQLKQKEYQLQDLIDKKNIIELKRKELEDIDKDSCYNLKTFYYKYALESLLNELDFHCVNSCCDGRTKEVVYEYYGDEKDVVEKAQEALRKVIIQTSTQASSYLLKAAMDCDKVDKEESKHNKNSQEKEMKEKKNSKKSQEKEMIL